jgi:hypothetical protein
MVVVFPLFHYFMAIQSSLRDQMPSLFRFLIATTLVGGLIYGGMFALATWFDPKPREITVSIPPSKFAKQR